MTSSTGLLLFGLAALGCGGRTDNIEQVQADELPSSDAAPSTECERLGTDWLELETLLPGHWHRGSEQGGDYTEVAQDLTGTWGEYTASASTVLGTSMWSRDEEGWVVETGAGPCFDASGCDARFVQRGTLAVGEDRLSFYALWPVDPCQEGLVGSYDGREWYENNDQTGGELQTWSMRRERLTLNADGTWQWRFETTQYATFNDMGTVYWDRPPSVSAGEDRGTYEAVADGIRFQREDPMANYAWVYSADGEPVELELIGRAIRKNGVDLYERMDAP